MKKRFIAEFIGTFFIVFVPVAISATGKLTGTDLGLLVAAVASGLPVLAMIYALGSISGAHFNPAVTLGFAIAKRFPWKHVPAYLLAQFGGSVAAAFIAALLFGGGSGVHIPADPSTIFRNLGTEALITFALMFVIISVATDKRVPGTIPALAIGAAVVFGVLVGGPITGGSMNPARSFGPALVGGIQPLKHCWLYFIGPVIGAALAAVTFEAIRVSPEYACNAPSDLV